MAKRTMDYLFSFENDKGKKLIKLKSQETDNDLWVVDREGKVFNFSKTLSEGDKVEADIETDGKEYIIKYLKPLNKNGKKDNGKSTKKSASTKSGNYKYPNNYMSPRVPEEAERMTKLSVLSSSCEFVSNLMMGKIDEVSTGIEMVKETYNELLNEVKQ